MRANPRMVITARGWQTPGQATFNHGVTANNVKRLHHRQIDTLRLTRPVPMGQRRHYRRHKEVPGHRVRVQSTRIHPGVSLITVNG